MRKLAVPAILAASFLGGCNTMQTGNSPQVSPQVSEQLAAIAAPGQDLTTARVQPENNCYWYAHRNPVETTLLPLKDVNGRPICAG